MRQRKGMSAKAGVDQLLELKTRLLLKDVRNICCCIGRVRFWEEGSAYMRVKQRDVNRYVCKVEGYQFYGTISSCSPRIQGAVAFLFSGKTRAC